MSVKLFFCNLRDYTALHYFPPTHEVYEDPQSWAYDPPSPGMSHTSACSRLTCWEVKRCFCRRRSRSCDLLCSRHRRTSFRDAVVWTGTNISGNQIGLQVWGRMLYGLLLLLLLLFLLFIAIIIIISYKRISRPHHVLRALTILPAVHCDLIAGKLTESTRTHCPSRMLLMCFSG